MTRPARRRVLASAVALATLAAAWTVSVAGAATQPQLVRGPYLQRGTPHEAIVRWRTDLPTDSWLAWGEAPGELTRLVSDPTPTTEHRLVLSGLQPATQYYYAIGDSLWPFAAAGFGDNYFRTPPLPGAHGTVRLWAVGDSGLPTSAQAAVLAAYLAEPGAGSTDAWLLLGDNAYYQGTDEQYQAGLFAPFRDLLAHAFLWPALGNHDAYASDSATQSGPFFADFSLPRAGQAGGLPSGTEAYYSFDLGDLHLICLDTADSDLSGGSEMLSWLAADLAATTQPWIIAFFHHPPYTKGTHDSDSLSDSGGTMTAVRENILPVLEAGGVALVLSGHSHTYERSFLLDGHYGTSGTLTEAMKLDGGDGDPAGGGAYHRTRWAHGGTVYAVAGAVALPGSGALNHPAMVFSADDPGSLVLDLAAGQLRGRYLDWNGAVLDTFVIVDDVDRFADGFESADTSRWQGAAGAP